MNIMELLFIIKYGATYTTCYQKLKNKIENYKEISSFLESKGWYTKTVNEFLLDFGKVFRKVSNSPNAQMWKWDGERQMLEISDFDGKSSSRVELFLK